MFYKIEDALADLKKGKPIIVVDDENRENEGDFVALSEKATPELINFFITHGRGLVCTTITSDRARKLNLNMMVDENTDPYGTAFTISVDHEKTETGISAFERAETIQALIDEKSVAEDFKRPGHVFPLIAKNGGVFERKGHTEASVDLAKLCDVAPSAVICEIINEDGTMSRLPQLQELAEKFDLKLIHIEDLIKYKQKNESLVQREVETMLPMQNYGTFKVIGYSNQLDNKEHIAVVKGDLDSNKPILVRIHSECLTGDVFGSKRCDCGPQLDSALEQISEEGAGVVIYLRQEGRGIGLLNKLKAYKLQSEGLDTLEANEALGFQADERDYTVAAQILKDLGIHSMRLLTNNPEKIAAMKQHNIDVVERVPHYTTVYQENKQYILTKIEKFGHLTKNN
ncbi:bifunctional 3,4-dihydroxy-2-butanone-4-phosphate synthase/GTP cyclohydrolase II [Virgibacillus sp. MSJ-26]|uniref:bifunctional 3,4-dihydroxy-2-butanone-4-phosphate synthase/GTP cyclohydrolase II n=1 Tax=Virgibacillus sp. MSJ-26 TaxID=2841522 RepID=UPI001C10F015|nr:bifunctional 3,4-dihydroxy-2-butanone-4-phosphate synthase/GTP cyclohydrolase II [Virgibacillus sp. MSJ-26]MBU5465949.1 bifunctional 3,4-dihydroxy-2-butanone-4-phosphate synthase/GTP cyclohydrolase II [Virgibacillus sp. MSJ-26]